MFINHSFRAAALAVLLAAGSAGAVTVPGESQSPIDIITADAVYDRGLAPLAFNYANSVTLNVVDTGLPSEEATVRADVPGGSTLRIGGTVYNLLQFHVHAEAEHLFNGVREAMELHLVHQAENGALAVVGQIIKIGTENTALAAYFSAFEAIEGGSNIVTNFNLAALAPADTRSYRYTGSLTAPNGTNPEEPFFEPVAWNVLAETIEVSQDQFDKFKALFPTGDARPVQDLNDRVVVTDVAPVPLPATGLLFVLALGGLAALRRRAA